MRDYSFIDHFIIGLDSVVFPKSSNSFEHDRINGEKADTIGHVRREKSGNVVDEPQTLSEVEAKKSEACMRVNHTGEVCAQALYLGQALSASHTLQPYLLHSSFEEREHLQWCFKRIEQLNGRQSYMNVPYFLASFKLGFCMGLLGDKVSLGFIHATEECVVKHLDESCAMLPQRDTLSRNILNQMKVDEKEHGEKALERGGREFPEHIKTIMKFISKLMTKVVYHI